MGSASSGNFGHAGRPGQVGGSSDVGEAGDRVQYRHLGKIERGHVDSIYPATGQRTITNARTKEQHIVHPTDVLKVLHYANPGGALNIKVVAPKDPSGSVRVGMAPGSTGNGKVRDLAGNLVKMDAMDRAAAKEGLTPSGQPGVRVSNKEYKAAQSHWKATQKAYRRKPL